MKNLIILFLSCLVFLCGEAQDFPEPMRPRRIVNDFTVLFSSGQANALEQKLRHFNDTSSTQIAVVSLPSLQGCDPNDYAQRLAEKWGIGQKGKDNGILILIKPKAPREKGQVAIAVGYGLESVIPDAIASRIVRNEILPAFRKGNYYAGVNQAVDVLIRLAGKEFTAEQYARKSKGFRPSLLHLLLVPLLFLFYGIILLKRRGYTTGSRGSNSIPPVFFGGFGGGNSFGSFSSGSGSFGGFGGGSFGGGGASGSW